MGRDRPTTYDSLSSEERRRLLLALLEESPRTDPSSDPSVDETARVRHHHVHLPKLAADGVIQWRRGLCCVERGPRFEEVRPLLERLVEDADQSPTSD